jgi:hypothetical protein
VVCCADVGPSESNCSVPFAWDFGWVKKNLTFSSHLAFTLAVSLQALHRVKRPSNHLLLELACPTRPISAWPRSDKVRHTHPTSLCVLQFKSCSANSACCFTQHRHALLLAKHNNSSRAQAQSRLLQKLHAVKPPATAVFQSEGVYSSQLLRPHAWHCSTAASLSNLTSSAGQN